MRERHWKCGSNQQKCQGWITSPLIFMSFLVPYDVQTGIIEVMKYGMISTYLRISKSTIFSKMKRVIAKYCHEEAILCLWPEWCCRNWQFFPDLCSYLFYGSSLDRDIYVCLHNRPKGFLYPFSYSIEESQILKQTSLHFFWFFQLWQNYHGRGKWTWL